MVPPSHWGPFIEAAETTKFNHAFSVSWSQGGEDLVLDHFLGGIINGTYVDVGAHHPSRFSVTRRLYQKGWTGINIDANPNQMRIFQKQRKRDINLSIAVGSKSFIELSIFEEAAISTINEKWKKKFLEEGNKVVQSLSIQGETLEAIIKKYLPNSQIHLLNVDAEGSDFQVIMSLNLEEMEQKKWPAYILIETPRSLKRVLEDEKVSYLQKLGYQIQAVLPMSTLLSRPDIDFQSK